MIISGIVCVHCGHEPDTSETYETGWAYSNDEGTDHYTCSCCGKNTVINHYTVKQFEVADKYEAEEYFEIMGMKDMEVSDD